MILSLLAAVSEAESHWRSFLISIKESGMGTPDSVTSDAYEGLNPR